MFIRAAVMLMAIGVAAPAFATDISVGVGLGRDPYYYNDSSYYSTPYYTNYYRSPYYSTPYYSSYSYPYSSYYSQPYSRYYSSPRYYSGGSGLYLNFGNSRRRHHHHHRRR